MEQLNKFREFFGRLSGKVKMGLLLGGVLIVVAVGIALVLNSNKKTADTYATLFSGLSEQEASEVMTKLTEGGVNYKYEPDGQIRVPAETVDQTRATLVVEGYPKNGFAYDTFLTHANMMSTESDKKSLKIWDMQDRLAATIRCIDGVKEAVVQISPGEVQKYVLDDTAATIPTASVMVTMKAGGSPTSEQVLGIQRLVAKSVANMDMGDVAVIDGNGLDVSVQRSDADSPLSDAKMSFEEKVQLQVEANILNVLEPMYGRNQVRVSAKCTADMEKIISEESGYTAPNAENNSGYISSQTLTSDNNGAGGVAGVPGAQSNTNIPQYNTQAGAAQENSSATSDTEFALNLKKTQSQNEAARIADLTVAVSINATDISDRAELTRLVANAAGIAPGSQADKIVIVNSVWPKAGIAPVTDPPAIPVTNPGFVFKKEHIKYVAAAGAVLLLLLIGVILLVRRSNKKEEAELDALMQPSFEDEKAILAELAKTKLQPITVEDERGREMKENIRDFAGENPEISAQLLKNWIRGGDDND